MPAHLLYHTRRSRPSIHPSSCTPYLSISSFQQPHSVHRLLSVNHAANPLRPPAINPKFVFPFLHHPNPLVPRKESTSPPSSSSTPPQHTPSTSTAPSSLPPTHPNPYQNKTPTSHPATTKPPPPSTRMSPSSKPPQESIACARKSSARRAATYWKSAAERAGIARIMIWGK